MCWPDPTYQPIHPPTHPPNYTPTHWWGSLQRFQIFKQNWNILISSSVIEFWPIPGSPGGGRWVDGGGGQCGCVGCLMHTCMFMHAHTHMQMHAKHVVNMINMDASMLAAICNFYTCIHVCGCMCMCVGTPSMPSDTPRYPPPICPLPRATGSPKH